MLECRGTVRELSGSDPHTTNNRMELTAAVRALEALKRPCRVTFYTDSEYLKNGITSWMVSWKRKGWPLVMSTVGAPARRPASTSKR